MATRDRDLRSIPGLAAAALWQLLVALNGFVVVQPNQAKVAVFLGRYMGTVRRAGFHWVTR
jgi:regulator of protease activity HflC (stomatin/prohibitin superfamily)